MGNDDAKTTAEGAARDASHTMRPATEGFFATRLGLFVRSSSFGVPVMSAGEPSIQIRFAY